MTWLEMVPLTLLIKASLSASRQHTELLVLSPHAVKVSAVGWGVSRSFVRDQALHLPLWFVGSGVIQDLPNPSNGT